MKKFLRVSALTKKYNSNTPHESTVLSGLTFDVDEGEFVTIVGANGAGKTTLFNIITGSITPTAGTVILDNQTLPSISECDRSRFISRVQQNPRDGTCASLTVAENLALAALKTKSLGLKRAISKTQKNNFADLLVSLNLGLEKKIDQKMALLSGGQKQAVALLMALMNKPKLLLLDEHTASLDGRAKSVILDLTQRLIKNNGLTTLMITHSIPDAIAYGDRLIVLRGGHIAYDVCGLEKKLLDPTHILKMLHT